MRIEHQPHITVLMPVYNAEAYVHEAITSVLQQTFSDFELLIINDGSTDGTLHIIKSFDDPRMVVVSQPNCGVAAALNHGLQLARAPYIARFDADDICYPERLQLQYGFMLSNPEYSIIGSAADYVDAKGEFIFLQEPAGCSDEELQALKYKQCAFIHSTVFYKKDVILNCGGYNEHAFTFEDHFLWATILADHKVCNFTRPLIKVRFNPESVTIDEKWHPAQFRNIKYNAIRNKSITEEDYKQLRELRRVHVSPEIKEAAYYAICGKKFLVNNYQPGKARNYIIKAIGIQPSRLDNYLLLVASFLPERVIDWLHYNPLKTAKP